MASRPRVPASVRRAVLVEAGHRCAIPACHQTTVEIAHIVPWSEVQEHREENLIALCPTCHTRFDRGEIDRISMQVYKANLGLLTSRYSDAERRLLSLFEGRPGEIVEVGGDRTFDFWYLVVDGMVELSATGRDPGFLKIQDRAQAWQLTPAGAELIRRHRNGQALS